MCHIQEDLYLYWEIHLLESLLNLFRYYAVFDRDQYKIGFAISKELDSPNNQIIYNPYVKNDTEN